MRTLRWTLRSALVAAVLIAGGCAASDEAAPESPAGPESTGEAEDDSSEGVLEKAREKTGEAWEATKEKSGEAWETTKEKSGDAWEATKEKSGDAWEATKEKTGDAWEAAKEKTGEVLDRSDEPEDAPPEE
jgi:hypothetical protein